MIAPPEVGAIGCGAQFEPCRAVVQSLSNDHQTRFDMMKGEQGCAGGMASLLGFTLTRLLQEKRPPGVSPHLHCCWVYRGKVVIAPQNHASVGAWRTFSPGVEAAERALRETGGRSANSLISPGMEFFKCLQWRSPSKSLNNYSGRAVSLLAGRLPKPLRTVPAAATELTDGSRPFSARYTVPVRIRRLSGERRFNRNGH